jgi:tetratricopeptide (TPR) repeat protein
LLATGDASYRTLLARAYSHAALDNLGLALVDCEVAARQLGDCDDYQVYQLRGYVLYRIGDLYGALEDLSHAIGLHGEQAVPYLWRGLIYHTLGDIEAACEDLVEFVLRQRAGVAIAFRQSQVVTAVV